MERVTSNQGSQESNHLPLIINNNNNNNNNIIIIIIVITKKSAKKTILCKSEQKGKFLVSLITFIALSQIRVIDHEENHLYGNKIAFSKREVQVSEGSINFIDSESPEQIFIVAEVNFGSLKHTLGVVVNITVVYLKRLNHKSNV